MFWPTRDRRVASPRTNIPSQQPRAIVQTAMAHLSNPSPAPPLKRSRRPAAPPSSAWYAARAILDETDTHYLISWEGSDPGTSAPFEPSWQPKRNASAALVRAWKCSGKRGGHHNNNAPGEDRKDGEHSTEVRRNLRAGESGGRDNLRRGTTVASSFPAKAIVAERGGRYRVAWAPDPRTGKEYADTWEPKHYVSRDLVDAFRRQKRERTRQKQQRQLKREQKAEEKQPSRYVFDHLVDLLLTRRLLPEPRRMSRRRRMHRSTQAAGRES